ncbi:ASCH domain-containing protein [Glaciibacter psychrotolerans]|uniref:Uncharacterized protein YhfF n=1 Tax=Glaciibacter psychrotolerans TaxID=670054 RepID=A0A7Z0EGA8_9MICO|nr:ASCH domain-containing protein [Leifsonia psychrotolerans]NYJ21129.1 uncharacterized protein YhfF [Leifsonia psychrotolerans]
MSFPTVDGFRTMELGTPGALRAQLNEFVLHGSKRATAGLLAEYVEESEPWETIGERLALVDDDLNRLGLIEITRVEPTTFGAVTWEFAQAEGEGVTDLADWREQHRAHWRNADGRAITDDTGVLCLYFVLLPDSGH